MASGTSARMHSRFVDWLVSAGQRVWQVLPNTPIGPGDSPYQSVSAFAGSPLMVALEPLIEAGWLGSPEPPAGGFDPHCVEYLTLEPWRLGQLRAACRGFFANASPQLITEFADWCRNESHWLDDYALFMTLQVAHEGQPWWQWPLELRDRDVAALAEATVTHADEIDFWRFVQWAFDAQWAALKSYANRHGISILGDLPIFIAHHSADCWARPDLYELDADCLPLQVAGVPPDMFSADGQRWGNPLYRWDRMAAENFAWWSARLRRALQHADGFRIDHFRGFAAYWSVPAEAATAMEGRWVLGPGKTLFDALTRDLGPLPIIAEDLGLITPDVLELRDACGFPGMKVLHFGFGGDGDNEYLPHNYLPRSVVYTGTHDNDTTLGWWATAPARERKLVRAYLGSEVDRQVNWALIRAACMSVSNTALIPMQDLLGLGGDTRMNLPGSAVGNWAWRFDWPMLEPTIAPRLAAISAATGRCGIEFLFGPDPLHSGAGSRLSAIDPWRGCGY